MDSINTLKIITHPQSQGAVNGDRVTFGVVAEGPGQLSYEWLKDGVPINDKSTSCVYTIESFVPAEHKGSYQCIVSSDGDDASQSVDLAMSLKAELKGYCLLDAMITALRGRMTNRLSHHIAKLASYPGVRGEGRRPGYEATI